MFAFWKGSFRQLVWSLGNSKLVRTCGRFLYSPSPASCTFWRHSKKYPDIVRFVVCWRDLFECRRPKRRAYDACRFLWSLPYELLWYIYIACILSNTKRNKIYRYNDEIIKICSTCVKNPERFVQLGVGWVLRELSLANLELVNEFLTDNFEYFSREGLRYAIEKMTAKDKQKWMKYKPQQNPTKTRNEKKRKILDEEDSDKPPSKKHKAKKKPWAAICMFFGLFPFIMTSGNH